MSSFKGFEKSNRFNPTVVGGVAGAVGATVVSVFNTEADLIDAAAGIVLGVAAGAAVGHVVKGSGDPTYDNYMSLAGGASAGMVVGGLPWALRQRLSNGSE